MKKIRSHAMARYSLRVSKGSLLRKIIAHEKAWNVRIINAYSQLSCIKLGILVLAQGRLVTRL